MLGFSSKFQLFPGIISGQISGKYLRYFRQKLFPGSTSGQISGKYLRYFRQKLRYFRSQIESFQPGCVLEFSETECMDRSCFFKAIRRLFQANQVSFQANQDLLEKVICCLKKLLENQNRIRLKFCLICLKKLLEKPRIPAENIEKAGGALHQKRCGTWDSEVVACTTPMMFSWNSALEKDMPRSARRMTCLSEIKTVDLLAS